MFWKYNNSYKGLDFLDVMSIEERRGEYSPKINFHSSSLVIRRNNADDNESGLSTRFGLRARPALQGIRAIQERSRKRRYAMQGHQYNEDSDPYVKPHQRSVRPNFWRTR